MSTQSGSIEHWKKYFQSANADIFEVIEQAIIVAASDCPKEFKIRRDEIAEKLFTCLLPRCSGCDGVELVVTEEEKEDDVVFKGNSDENDDSEDVGYKESKVNSSNNDYSDLNVSNFSYHEAEALTEMIEEENQTIEEVFRIKQIVENSEDESTGVLIESLRRLELMGLSMQTLLTTNIGKAVSSLRKHHAKEIRHLARSLVDAWKTVVSEWVAATEAVKGSNSSPDSVNPSVIDEEEFGLPSPPLDEGAFFVPETTSMELSKFFDDMDDYGNPDCGGLNNRHRHGRRPTSESKNVQKENKNVQNRRPQFPQEENVLTKDKSHQKVKQETVIKQTKPSNSDSVGRPSKLGLEQKVNNEVKLKQKLDIARTQRKPQQDKSKCAGGVLDQKLEAAKRKLHQGYQQAENAKKQRTIQVMELHDLPKQSLVNKNAHVRHGSHNRHWSNGRR